MKLRGAACLFLMQMFLKKSALINLKAHIRNSSVSDKNVTVTFELKRKSGEFVKRVSKKLTVQKGDASYAVADMKVDTPLLWSPDHPYLYDLEVMVKENNGRIVDGYRQRIGIRSIDLNKRKVYDQWKPYEGKIMGTNRHRILLFWATLYRIRAMAGCQKTA